MEKREKITLDNSQWDTVVNEYYYTDLEENDIEFDMIKEEVIDVERYYIEYHLILQRLSDNKYFSISFKKTQENFSFEYYNKGNTEMTEVFPITKTTITYE